MVPRVVALLVLVTGLLIAAESWPADDSGNVEAVAVGPDALTALFIGNSLTFYNEMPRTVAFIAMQGGHELAPERHTPGGARLAGHVEDDGLAERIAATPWDVVVIQAQSQIPGFNQEQLERDLYPHAATLVEAARRSNPDVTIVFYQAMARKNGDPENTRLSHELATYEGAQRRVSATYVELAKRNRGLVAPVGEAWAAMRAQHPDVELYADPIHPNATGSYLAACVFYSTLFEVPCTGTNAPDSVDPEIVNAIHTITDRTVLWTNEEWDFRN